MPLIASLCCLSRHSFRLACGATVAAVLLLAPFAALVGQERQSRPQRGEGRARQEGNVDGRKADAQKSSDNRAQEKTSAAEKTPQAPSQKSDEKPVGEQLTDKQLTDKQHTDEQPSPPVSEQLQQTADGKFRFSFQGQSWLEVLQWLARNSKLTLDWQELPADKLNLTTQTSYSLDEARDLFNMHLAARGFTLLRRGEVLGLVKLDKLNPALVTRIEPSELDSRDPHEIVRVSFPLEWLVAEEAVKEFEPMKSPFGKLTAMTATNRLEAMDTVDNLLEIREMLSREQSPQGEDRLVVEFKLKHVRAEDILAKLQTLVGGPGAGLRPQDRARMQMMMRMRGGDNERNNNNNNNNNNSNRNNTRQEPEVHLVVNEQENSILANAPPDKLAVVRQAVQALDVPLTGNGRASDAATRMRIYRTKAIDPEAMSDLIEELVSSGKLGASTQVQSDDNSNTLIVYATPADHMAIANLVDQIGDDGRGVRIIALSNLTPDYALQAVNLLMKGEGGGGLSGGGSGDEGGGRWRRRGGGGGGGGGGSGSSGDQFRIEADVERNRLLLWASDMEYEQVKDMLAKLGEGSGTGVGIARGNLRILNVPSRGTEQALESLQQIWPHLRTNPLQIRGMGKSSERRATESSSRDSPSESPRNRTTSSDPSGTSHRLSPSVLPAALTLAVADDDESGEKATRASGDDQTLLAQVSQEEQSPKSVSKTDKESTARKATPNVADRAGATEKTDEEAAKSNSRSGAERRAARPAERIARADASEPPAITITEGPGGQLIVTSQDVDALDAVEKLIAQIMPRQADYEVFRLRHASPYAIELTLSQIFGVSSLTEYGSRSGMPMGTRTAMQFVSDVDTGTLLVQGATPEQLRKIAELIELYDQPETLHEDLQRKTEIYEVRYSRADSVAEVVKEVFRDLLSVNDKAFTRERTNENGRSNSTLGYGTNYATRIPQFRGLLSIGVEQPSNTLVVSAPVYLIGDVMKLVREVDERSASHKPRVVQLNGVGAETLRSVLAQIPGVTVSAPGSIQQSPSSSGFSRSPSPDRDNGEARFSMPSRGEFGNRGDFGNRNRTGVGGPRFESNSPRGGAQSRRGDRD